MENYYEAHMNSIANQLYEMLEAEKVINFFKSIYYGNDETEKKRFVNMMFLVDPKFENPDEWVKKAIFEFNTKDIYSPIREENWHAWMKCLFVKTHRVLTNGKRKKKLDPTVTIEEITTAVLAILNA